MILVRALERSDGRVPGVMSGVTTQVGTGKRSHTSAGGFNKSGLQKTFDYATPTDAGGLLMVVTIGRTLKKMRSREGSSTNEQPIVLQNTTA